MQIFQSLTYPTKWVRRIASCTRGGALKSLLLIAGVTLLLSPAAEAGHSVPVADQALLKAGERMYRDGILPDGKPMKALVRDDVEIDSTIFSCTNCHTRSGLGSLEGEVASPPVSGPYLFSNRYQYKDYLKNYLAKRKGVDRSAIPVRPAYDDTSLSRAISFGVNPAGREFIPVMPRYELTDSDMQALTTYLRSLSATPSPGVDDDTMHIATVIAGEVPREKRDAMLLPLQRLVEQNRQAASLKKNPRYQKFARMLDEAFFRRLRLSVWELKGDPSTWNTQLQELYRKDPPFALVGGISQGDWQPVHDFCETMQLPSILPITDYPVVSDSGWYTLYFNRGFRQEGETAASYVASRLQPSQRVTIIGDGSKASRLLAEGARSVFTEKGVSDVDYREVASPADLSALVADLTPHTGALLLFTANVSPILVSPRPTENLPGLTVLSASLSRGVIENLPDNLKERLLFTWPYRLPQDEKRYADFKDTFLLGKVKLDATRIASRTFSMIHVFLIGLREMKLDFHRDTLIDQISMAQDQYLPDFERLSFGPGQRYLSKGCYIVQVGKSNDTLIRKTDWVTY